jgi:DDE superfamily endonuclease
MGHGFLQTSQKHQNGTKELAMSPMKRYANKHIKARKRRRLKAQERLKQQRAQAQHYIEALHQALKDLDFPDTLVAEIEGRLRAQQQLLGKIVALMFPTLFGCRHGHELTRVRGWNKNIPSQLLGALPKRSWLKRLRRLGLEILLSIWRYTQGKSASTRSRWQWRWIVDDSVFRKYGTHLGLVGTWYSGQFKRTVPGIDGVLLLVVIGDGKLIIPLDFAIRRPNPKGPGRRCYDKLTLTQNMLDERWAAFAKRGVTFPAPLVVADSWFSDSKLMRYVAKAHQGTLLVQGKSSYTFTLEAGRKVKGSDLVNHDKWSWQQSLHAPGCHYVRLRARSRTYGQVLLIVVAKPGEKPFYLISMSLTIQVTRLIQAWNQRYWIEQMFRLLKHLLAAEACQARSEDAYYGHLVLRLMAGFVLFYTSRVIFKGHVTMEEIVFTLKHHWMMVDYEPFELYAIA